MTKPEGPEAGGRPTLPGTATYQVGYGRPPLESRFTPGRSGNPKGRPKGARGRAPGPHEERLKAIIQDEAYRTVTIKEGGRRVSVTMAEAIVRALAVNAARGDLRAQQLFTRLLLTTERENRRNHDELLEAVIGYKTDWERELAWRQKAGVIGPDPVPHPDDIHVDLSTGAVRISGLPAPVEEA